MTNEKAVTAEIGGQIFNFQKSHLAPQTNGSVLCRVGDTVVLATVVMQDKIREGVDYLPLMVDYEEKLYAAGKIKGSRWIKREGRPTDEAVLKGRVIDRSLRPMFDERIRQDLQVVVTVLSVDGKNDPAIIGLNAASAAVAISDVPWDGPIAAIRIGKINGNFVINPSFADSENESVLDLIVSGTEDHVIMVEAEADEVSEEDMLEAIKLAHQEIKKVIIAIKSLSQIAGVAKRELNISEIDASLSEKVAALREELSKVLFESPDKFIRDKGLDALKERALVEFGAEDGSLRQEIGLIFEKLVKQIIQEKIIKDERRVDGRKLDEVRTIECEVGLLPRVHGSGLFQRELTQVLTTVTLGSPGDVQLLEDIETEEEREKRYIHHYNFPGFSVGEVKPMRSPGRREIGHGALAERALERMIPPKESFPYTLRLVSEVLSSNGSTSMASTCGSTLALMDAGVPIKSPVSGIAMGLVFDEQTGEYKILSDIQGIEDTNGHMDFKVAGTKTGITVLQMDIKIKGLTHEILSSALMNAKKGRMHILDKMLSAIPVAREDLSKFAPRIIAMHIDPEKIRNVIGPGGKVINEIIAQTGVKIDIEDSGLVMITSSNSEASQKAQEWVNNLTREVKAGEEFEGVVTRILDFGAMVEILPDQTGLIHVSELAPYRVEKVTDEVKIGDMVKVRVKEIDELGRINLTRREYVTVPPDKQDQIRSNPPSGGPRGGFDRGGGHDRNRGRRFAAHDRK